MDPVTAIGVASAIVQFVQFGLQVASKLNEEIRRSPGDVPGALENINTQLPLILNALSRIRQENSASRLDPDTRGILNGVVLGCSKLAHEIDEILINLASKPGESLGRKLKKVLVSMRKETRIAEINQGLLAYVQVLVLHQVVDKAEVQAGPPPETEFFEVKEKRVAEWLDRTALTNRIDQALLRVVRGQAQQPTWLILEGAKDFGKTQLALEYCRHAYKQAQFRTVFWLDASTAENLKLSIENASSIVRKSRDGTREMKLSFFNDFLVDRYRPWLLVLDGYDESQYPGELLADLLPTEGHGAILVTTRDQTPLNTKQTIAVYKYRTVAEYDDLRKSVTQAISRKDIATIVRALEQDLDVNCYTKNMWQNNVIPLVNHAAREGFGEAVNLLLNRGASLEQDRKIGSVVESARDAATLNTILDWEDHNEKYASQAQYQRRVAQALKHGEVEIIETMLARRLKDFNADNECYSDGFVEAAEQGRLQMFRTLWALGKMPRHELTKACMLYSAVNRAQTDMVSFLLLEFKCDVNKLAFGEPVLYVLVQKYDKQFDDFRRTVLPLLLDGGASPNALKPSMGMNSFHIAASNGLVPEVRAFIEHGGDVTVEDEQGRDALRTAAQRKITELYPILTDANIPDVEKRREYLVKALFHAARTGDRELALAAVKDESITAAIDLKSGDTPLLAAIRASNDGLPVARMLARKTNQQRGVTDREGRTPLGLAAEFGLASVVRDLARAKDCPGINVTDQNGNTPLMLAVRAGDEKTVDTLLSLGADRDAINKYGETAEDIAEDKGMNKVLEKLQGFELVN